LDTTLALSLSTIAFADFTGSVVSVLDSDTIEVLHNQHPKRIRLSGIDGPVCHNSEWWSPPTPYLPEVVDSPTSLWLNEPPLKRL